MDSVLVTGAARAHPLTPEEIADIERAAAGASKDPQELRLAHIGVNEFAELATSIELEYEGSFVRWGLSEPGEAGQLWILFTEMPASATLARLAQLAVDTRVIAGASAAATELSEISGALVESLASHKDVYRYVGTRSDRYATRLTVEYALKDTDGVAADLSAFEAAALEAADKASTSGHMPIPISFERVDHRAAVESVVQGGRDLHAPYGPGGQWIPWCTAGFTATVDGDSGVLTAQHCPDNTRYNNLTNVISVNPEVAADAANGEVDLQWHRTLTGNGHSTNKQFRATGLDPDTDDRTVQSVANGGLGTVVCHWGMMSGYDCSTIADIDQCKSLSGVTYCGLDTTANDVSEGGDSGGPWFLGSSARGTHSGGAQGVASFYTRIGRVQNNLGGTVLEE